MICTNGEIKCRVGYSPTGDNEFNYASAITNNAKVGFEEICFFDRQQNCVFRMG